MGKITFTTARFIAALRRAEADDRTWPWMRSADWLLDHARSKDGEVIVDTAGENAPEALWQSVGRSPSDLVQLCGFLLANN
jgi:hypothetical protein